jgi:hypothetical protein
MARRAKKLAIDFELSSPVNLQIRVLFLVLSCLIKLSLFSSMVANENINGYWFLPTNSEVHCYGELVFGPLASPRLTLTATTGNDLSMFPYDAADYVIWGYDIKGESISLFGCNRLNIGSFGRGIQTSMFNAQYVIIGEHITTSNAKEFDNVRFSFDGFEDWVNIFGYDINLRSAHSFTISYEQPTDIPFEINDNVCGCLTFWNNKPYSNTREIVLHQDSLVKLTFKSSISLEDILTYVWKMQQFITLLMFEQTKVKWIFIGNGGKELRLFYRQHNPDLSKDDRTLYLLPFRLVKDQFGYALMKWFGLAEELNPIISILHANIGNSKEFVHNNFLNIVQAVEAFHRRKIQSTEQLKFENKQLVSRILENITKSEDKKWLESKLAFSYEPNLRVRIKGLIAEHQTALFTNPPANKDISRLITNIVEKRNYFTHYDSSLTKDEDETVKIISYTRFLKTLLAFCLLGQVGFGSNFLKDNIYNRFRFKI